MPDNSRPFDGPPSNVLLPPTLKVFIKPPSPDSDPPGVRELRLKRHDTTGGRMPKWLENAWFKFTSSDKAIAQIALRQALDAIYAETGPPVRPRVPQSPPGLERKSQPGAGTPSYGAASARGSQVSGPTPATPAQSPANARTSQAGAPASARDAQASTPARGVPPRTTALTVSHRYSGKDVIEVRDQTFFRALCAGSCLAALADGIVQASELDILTRAVRNVMEISGYAESEALAYFQVCADALSTNRNNRDALLGSVGAIRHKIWQARRLMRVCLDLCHSDNDLSDDEKQELKEICLSLSLNPRHYGLPWVEPQVRSTSDGHTRDANGAESHGKEHHGKEVRGKESHGKEVHGKESHGTQGEVKAAAGRDVRNEKRSGESDPEVKAA